jgi:hypothetical protein
VVKSIKKTLFKFYLILRNKGFVPPIIERRVNVNKRIWNDVESIKQYNVSAIINGSIDGLSFDSDFEATNSIFLFGQPKSASLFHSRTIASVFRGKEYWIGFNGGAGEFFFPRVVAALEDSNLTVSHSHAVANKNIRQFLDKINSRIIVTYRNLADSLVSRKEMLERDGWSNSFITQESISHFNDCDDQQKYSMVIDAFCLNYLNFYTSWKEYASSRELFLLNMTTT